MSGNVIDLCPVGALTNKPFRFKARAWELMSVESISMHDAIGSNLFYHTRDGKILRTVPKDNEALNEAWLSDRDRYGVLGQDAQDRVLKPMIKENGKWKDTDWPTAMDFAVKKLQSATGKQTAVFSGSQSTNEEYHLLAKLFKALDCDNIDYRINQTDFNQTHGLPRVDIKLEDVLEQDQIVLVGSNVLHEQPIFAHRVRQAWLKNNAKISVFNPKQYNFQFETFHHYVANQIDWVKGLGSLAHCVADLKKSSLTDDLGKWIKQQATDENLNHLAKKLIDTDSKVLFVIGQITNKHPQAGLIKALVAWLSNHTNGKVYEMAMGANSVGANICGMVSANNTSQILAKDLKSVVLYQTEIEDFANSNAALNALNKADSVVAICSFATETLKQVADVILPIGLTTEVAGSFYNNFSQKQSFVPAARLVADSKPGWRLLRVLANLLNVKGFDFEDITSVANEANKHKVHAGHLEHHPKHQNLTVEGLVLHAETGIYDVDMLTRRSTPLQQTVHASSALVSLNSIDAAQLKIENAAPVVLAQGESELSLFANIDDKVPVGSVYVQVNNQATLNLNSADLNVTLTRGEG
jgi:NADH-quinone oxidoreductase subunit G